MKYLIGCFLVLNICILASGQENDNVIEDKNNWIVPWQSGLGGGEPIKIKIVPPFNFVFKNSQQFQGPNYDIWNDITSIDIKVHRIENKVMDENGRKTLRSSKNFKPENVYIKDTIVNQREVTLSKWKVKIKMANGISNEFKDFFYYKLVHCDSLNWFTITGSCPIDSLKLDATILKSILTFDYKYVSVFEIFNINFGRDFKKLKLKPVFYSFNGKNNSIKFTNNGKILPSKPDFTAIEITENSIIDIPDLTKIDSSIISGKLMSIKIPIKGSYTFKMRADTIDLYSKNYSENNSESDVLFKSLSRDSVAYLIYRNLKSMHVIPPKLIIFNPVIINNLPGCEFSSEGLDHKDFYTQILFDETKYYVVHVSCSKQSPETLKKIKSILNSSR